MTKVQQWAQDHKKHSDNPPPEGTILRAMADAAGVLHVELTEGQPPFVYGRAYVPHIIGKELGWFLEAFDAPVNFGIKLILMPKSREETIRRFGMTEKKIKVKALRLVRYSKSKTSILCEVAEYWPTPAAAADPPQPLETE